MVYEIFLFLSGLNLPEHGVLALPVFPNQLALGDVKGVAPEEAGDLLLELGQVARVEGVLEALHAEQEKGLVEALVALLVGEDLGLELHERVALLLLLFADRLVVEHDPAVGVAH